MSDQEQAMEPATKQPPARRHRRRGPELALRFGGVELTIRGWQGIVTLATIVLVAAALVQELSQPAGQRTWHGRVFGAVPYDFRIPTFAQARASFWDPKNPHLFTDRVLGIGWSVNLARLWALARA